MLLRLRRFLDLRPGEGLPVLLSFLYVGVVAASFLLARPIRNSLFLKQYGPYALVYVYAAVPLVLSLFVPIYTRVAVRFGTRAVTVATLVFFSANVVVFWYLFRRAHVWILPAVFYVWVNCFGVIAPVQAWSFANSLFDTRQAKRLFGLIGAGASLGAIGGGFAARFLVKPVGGTVNMMLVLAAFILSGAAIVVVANLRIRRRGLTAPSRPPKHPFQDSLRQIGRSRYLQLMAATVFLVAVVTQWTGFQLSLVANERFAGNADALTRFFGTFNLLAGSFAFVLQLLVTGPALRRFGLIVTILVLPLSLGFGTVATLLWPTFLPVLMTNGFDQGFRFSIDKATYELLYLPLPSGLRAPLKNAIDIVIARFADATGAVLLGLTTAGFWRIPGLGLGLRGTSAVNLVVIAVWAAVAWRLRTEYVRTIQASIHKYRVDVEKASTAALDVASGLAAADPADVREALELLEMQQARQWQSSVRLLLKHPEPDIRRRALAILSNAGDPSIAGQATEMLRDADIGVRTEALLYVTREMGVDPLQQLEELGDFEDFSIRAGMAAFFACPGRAQNLDAARAILEAMARSDGSAGKRDRLEAARLLAFVPDSFTDLLQLLITDRDSDVACQAIKTARALPTGKLRPSLIDALGRPDLVDEAAAALAHHGEPAIPEIELRLEDSATPLEIKRELPAVLVRIGTPWAERILVESLLQADAELRHRIIISLNQLHSLHRDVPVDRPVIDMLLAAEIVGHYRSYQVLGPLRAHLQDDHSVLDSLRQSMERELERIFRLMSLLYPSTELHDAYVGVRSSNPTVRANALEFLDNVLPPELRQVLVPLLDSQVTLDERVALAERMVGTPLEGAEQAAATLLGSDDPWLRSCGIVAVGALQIHGLEKDVRRFEHVSDPSVRQAVATTLRRLATEPDGPERPPVPPAMTVRVGAG
jgi:ATP:ADP antiporter, AAA family